MAADVLVDCCFHLELARADFAMAGGVVFVDELDSENWAVGLERAGVLDAVDVVVRICKLVVLGWLSASPTMHMRLGRLSGKRCGRAGRPATERVANGASLLLLMTMI